MNMRRRNFLRGAGLSALLPYLPSLGCSTPETGAIGRTSAAATDGPKRFVVFYTPNGFVMDDWRPDGSDTALDLSRSPILEPLAPHAADMICIDGLDLNSAENQNHPISSLALLTGSPVEGERTMSGISIDQAIAEQIGGDTALRSLELGVQTRGFHTICSSGYNRPLPMADDPAEVFDRLFGDATADPDEADLLRARRRSVLDGVGGELSARADRAGGDDRLRLEAHLDAVRDLENRLDSMRSASAGCTVPARPTVDPRANDSYPEVGRAQMDLLAMSFACDLTRVATLQWSYAGSQTVFRWLGIDADHHEIAHANSDQFTESQRWYAEQLAYLIERLKAIPEGDGTVFDNTCIVWVNELGMAGSHDTGNVPFTLAGSAGGALRTGRYLDIAGDHSWGCRASNSACVPHNDLWVSMLRAYGVDADTFGAPDCCTGALPGLA
jgi:hypothetical protein